jgi:hypothetical protein
MALHPTPRTCRLVHCHGLHPRTTPSGVFASVGRVLLEAKRRSDGTPTRYVELRDEELKEAISAAKQTATRITTIRRQALLNLLAEDVKRDDLRPSFLAQLAAFGRK